MLQASCSSLEVQRVQDSSLKNGLANTTNQSNTPNTELTTQLHESGQPILVEAAENVDTRAYETFDDMGLQESLLRGIYAYGFERPSAIQQRAIVPLSRGHDIIAQAQSGSGKTASSRSESFRSLPRLAPIPKH